MICLVLFLVVAPGIDPFPGGEWAATVGALVFMMTVLLFMKGFKQKGLIIGIAVATIVVGGHCSCQYAGCAKELHNLDPARSRGYAQRSHQLLGRDGRYD